MVDRIILVKLVQPDQRQAVADELLDALDGIPGVTQLSVGVPSDEASRKSWDLSVVLRCENRDVLEGVLASQAFVRCHASLSLRADCIKAWSFTTRQP